MSKKKLNPPHKITYAQLNKSNRLLCDDIHLTRNDLKQAEDNLQKAFTHIVNKDLRITELEKTERTLRQLLKEMTAERDDERNQKDETLKVLERARFRIRQLKSSTIRWMRLIGDWRASQNVVTVAELLPVTTADEKHLLESEKVNCRLRFHELLTAKLRDKALDYCAEDGHQDHMGECVMTPETYDRDRGYHTGDILEQKPRR